MRKDNLVALVGNVLGNYQVKSALGQVSNYTVALGRNENLVRSLHSTGCRGTSINGRTSQELHGIRIVGNFPQSIPKKESGVTVRLARVELRNFTRRGRLEGFPYLNFAAALVLKGVYFIVGLGVHETRRKK